MRNLQLIGAALIIAGAVLLYLLRGPLVSIIFLVIELFVIFIAIVMVLVGVALIIGGPWIRRGFPRWMHTW
ncbi:MAG: hypothetical protein LYZ70_00995 [Nitrososphaerales archaeon]|nr:hypothetical protein [Nitrososphaerales archaeon]